MALPLLGGRATLGGESVPGPGVRGARAGVVDVAAGVLDGRVRLNHVGGAAVGHVERDAIRVAGGDEIDLDGVALQVLAGQADPAVPDEVLLDHGALDPARVAAQDDPGGVERVVLDEAVVAAGQADAAAEDGIATDRALDSAVQGDAVP